MSETTTQRLKQETLEKFNALKAKYVSGSTSFDDFLSILLTVYETRREEMKAKA